MCHVAFWCVTQDTPCPDAFMLLFTLEFAGQKIKSVNEDYLLRTPFPGTSLTDRLPAVGCWHGAASLLGFQPVYAEVYGIIRALDEHVGQHVVQQLQRTSLRVSSLPSDCYAQCPGAAAALLLTCCRSLRVA